MNEISKNFQPKFIVDDESKQQLLVNFANSAGGILLFAALIVGVTSFGICELTRPQHIKPWWFNDSQVGWEIKNQVTPKGYDEISQYLIDGHGMTFVPWEPDGMWAYVGTADRRHQWMGNTLLVRMKSGNDSIFGGGDRLHHPLIGDEDLPLIEQLHLNDSGSLILTNDRGRTPIR